MIVVAVFVFIALFVYEVPELLNNKEWRSLAAFCGLMMLAMGLTVLYMLEVPIPNPNPLIELLISPVSQIFKQYLGQAQ